MRIEKWSCDRCGRVFEDDGTNTYLKRFSVSYTMTVGSATEHREIEDVCNTCNKDFIKHIRAFYNEADGITLTGNKEN